MIQALPTKYRGITFRSRTEARWALFLDEMNVAYSYEIEGFDLSGEWYLPDFWLPVPGVWIEVKGTAPTDRETRVARLLSAASRCPVLIAVGPPAEDYTLMSYFNGQPGSPLAFVGDERHDLFIGSASQEVMMTIRGSRANLSGVPDPVSRAVRLAAATRFGVHEDYRP